MPHEVELCCPKYQRASELLTRRWTPQIVRMLLSGSQRFSELRNAIPGLSDRLLSERLKELEEERILERRVFPDTPVRIEYQLTQRGLDLAGVVGAIQRWADKWEVVSAAVTSP